MATPTFFRYLPSRLKPLGIPAIWISLGLFGLISAFIWQYHENPQWFDREPIGDVVNSESGLTPEEESQLAEIDTLDVLLKGSRLPDGSPEVTSIINPNAPDAATANGDGKLSGQVDPFKAYSDEYRFPGASETTLTTGNQPAAYPLSAGPLSSGSSNSGMQSSGVVQSGRSAPAARSQPVTNSALSQALDRQRAAEAANTPNRSGGFAPGGVNSRSYLGGGGGSPDNLSGAQSAQPPITPIPSPYIRTTSEMSPSPGTTGYQTPATSSLPVFNLAPPQPTRNFAPNATAAPSNVDFPSGTLYTAPTSIQPVQPQPAR